MGNLSTTRVLLIGLVAVALASFLPLGVSGYILGLLTIAYYFGVFAMAWDLLFGFAGEVNFGPTFLIGTGAYTAGILDNLYQPPIWICVAAGEIGLTVPDVITISDAKNYEIALWFMAISGAILFALSSSPVGLILQASGQDAVQAGALGFNVTKHKLTAFVISAFFSGLAGALLVFYLGSASGGTFIHLPVGDLANFIVFAMALFVVLTFPNGFFGLLTRSKETSCAWRKKTRISKCRASASASAAWLPSRTWH